MNDDQVPIVEFSIGDMTVRARVDGQSYERRLPDGRSIWLYIQLFNALLCIGRTDDLGWDRGWEYETMPQALVNFLHWQPEQVDEPAGWIRCTHDGRRRPHGDASREYTQP